MMPKSPTQTAAYVEDLTQLQIMTLLHGHAVQIKNTNPDISHEKALQEAAELAVLAFDVLYMKQLLVEAARLYGLHPELAALVVKPRASASASLTDAA